ncbi:MAG TPA: Xaa-Pro dipeptidyl-peptidase [Candidatus Avamphibacillus sp.]|nr:Xaa-Pro dipeptidyl-peptidase [Candidatus Avamphibacillus sp.]
MFKKSKQKIHRIFLLITTTIMISTPVMSVSAEIKDQELDIPKYHLDEGVTEPIYSYEDAIKETIYVESTIDSDKDGNADRIAIDVMRPEETEDGLEVPVIMDASPYYERLGRGNESEIKDPNGDGNNDMFPLYYDNYFVPRGYAVVLLDMVGTNNSDGCPTTGGHEEIDSVEVVIDWLNGKGKAWDEDGQEVIADWSTGKVGMIGKSYDGTLANGAAARGIEGLETIVPIGAISSWYDYYRYGGIPFYYNGPAGLSRTVTNSDRIDHCSLVREELSIGADDATGDYNEFWAERDFVKDADKVTASVFAIHGLNDYNVKANHFSNWWEELAENDVPRKLWLTQTGHVDPFDFRREEWVDTLHRWFDYWLLDIDNGIMDEPTVDIEKSADEWETHSVWPDEEVESVEVKFAPASNDLPGTLTTAPIIGESIQSFVDDPKQSEKQMVEDEFTQKENRLIFLTDELEEDMRLSGVPEINIDATVDKEDTNLTALIVDYGMDERVDHRSREEGIRTLDSVTCWGESSEDDNACYKETEKVTHEAPYEIVTHGWLDAQNWQSLDYFTSLEPGKEYSFQWDTLPEDYVFKEGHRLGIIIAGSDRNWLTTDDNEATIDVTIEESHIKLPIVGGIEAFNKAIGHNGGTSPETTEALKNVVQYYDEKGAFEDEITARALFIHLRAVQHYEENGSIEKAVKHLENFKVLLAFQQEAGLMSEEAFRILKIDTNYLFDLFNSEI